MLKITKVLNPFPRRWGYGYVIERKEPIAGEGEKKRGAQEMKVHPDMWLITKARENDILDHPAMFMKKLALKCSQPLRSGYANEKTS